MRKTFRYRLRPTPAQARAMEHTLGECRWLYNYLLEQRKIAYEEHGATLTLYGQQATLPSLKAQRPSLAYLTYKAEGAGRVVAAVNPAYTSQTCSRCGHRQRKELSERVHCCSCCGLTLDRDHNAALNILALGRQSLASA